MTDLITVEEAGKLAHKYRFANNDLERVLCETARTVIFLRQQLADAKAAQALVVERCADRLSDLIFWTGDDDNGTTLVSLREAKAAIRALADADGFAAVEALRAERDALRAAVEGMIAVLDRNDKKGPIPDVEMMFCWLAAQDVRAAFRKITPKGEAT